MNKAILMGRLTRDPELSYTKHQNTAVTKFSIAVDRKFKREGSPTADFFNCIAWGKSAEFVKNYFQKGKMIAIDGRIENRSWNDEQGNKKYATDIQVDSVFFAGSKSDDGGQSQSQPSGGFNTIDDDDDELPF